MICGCLLRSRGVPCSRLCANTSLGWRHGLTHVTAYDSNLLVGSSQIRSQRGVQQGDPLGPSFFALAIHPCIIEAIRVAECQHNGDVDFKAFFLDGGVIAGKAPAVQLFLATLEFLLREIGLDIARRKSDVASACSSVQNFSPRDFEDCTWVPDGNIKLPRFSGELRPSAFLHRLGQNPLLM